MGELAQRSFHGDTTARAELRKVGAEIERRYHAPDELRTSGELWRDSVLAVAGIPSMSSYDLQFSLDDGSIATRLAALAGLALLLEYRRRGLQDSRRGPIRRAKRDASSRPKSFSE